MLTENIFLCLTKHNIMKSFIKVIFFNLFILSCDPANQNIDSQNFSVPEPVISDQLSITNPENARFKLTDISVMKNPSLKINDIIIFNDIEDIEQNKKRFNKVQLTITTHCLVDNQQVIIKDIKRKLRPAIPIIELLPEAVLLAQNTPSCGFSFTAKNPAGAEHHFEMPQLPITDYRSDRFITIIDNSKTDNKNKTPYLFMNKRKDYSVNTGHETAMDTLNLNCKHLSNSISLRSEQWLPFSAFSNKFKNKTIDQNPYQQCRVLGYNKDTLVAASKVFHLVYPHQPPYVSIDTINHDPDDFYADIMGDKEDNKSKDVEIDMYSYQINNPHSYPVTLWMNYRPGMELDLYSLYQEVNYNGMDYTESDKMYLPFYVSDDFNINLRNPIVEQGQATTENTDDGLLLKLQPHTKVKIPVSLTDSNLCKKAKTGDEVRWLGAIYTPPQDLKVYALDTRDESFSESKTELSIYRSKKPIALLTTGLEKKNSSDDTTPVLSNNLWFMESSCLQASRTRDKTFKTIEPLLELRRDNDDRGSFDIHWLEEPDPLLSSTYKEKIAETKTAILYYIDRKNPGTIYTDGMGGGSGE